MVQQQLVVLFFTLAGLTLAITAGFYVVHDQNKEANLADLTQDVLALASDVQLWRTRAASDGGGAANPLSTPWTGLTLEGLGYDTDLHGLATSAHGTLRLHPQAGTIHIIGTNEALGNQVTAVVSGLSLNDITLTRSY